MSQTSVSLAIDSNGTPYIAYEDYGSSSNATVMKFNGTAWENVGEAGFSADNAYYTSLAFDSTDTPYIAYKDGSDSDKATVMKFSGNSWVNVSNPGFSADSASYISLAMDSDDIPYVAYMDVGNSGKATVMRLNVPPTGMSLDDNNIAENEPIGNIVGALSTEDPDKHDAHTYALVSGTGDTDNGSFTINGNQLKTAESFDYEIKNTYSVRVRSNDKGGLYTENEFSVEVTNVDENSALTIDTPNLLAGTIGESYTCTLTASGGDGNYSWYASGLPSGLSIAHDTGTIFGKPNETGTFSVDVQVYDGAGKRAEKTYSLTVNAQSQTGKYTITPETDSAYTVSTPDGFATLTVGSGVSGFRYMKVRIDSVITHEGEETVVFVHMRDKAQIGFCTSTQNFDIMHNASVGFNVSAGDVIRIYIVDCIGNDPDTNPMLLQ